MKKLVKISKYAFGGSLDNGTPPKKYDPNAGYNETEGTGTSTASAIGPWWGALSKVGTSASTSIRGDGSDETKNQAADFANPFNQFSNNRNTEDWVVSFLNPVGSSLHKGKRIADDKKANDKALDDYQWMLNSQAALQRGGDLRTNNMYSLTQRKMGGKLSKLSDNTLLAEGASHEEGGIKIPQLGAEVEDGETLKKMKDGGAYVMSDTIINPKTGNTFAKDDLKLSKTKGKLEKMNNGFSNNALSLLKGKEQDLVELHEKARQERGLDSDDNIQVAKNGGKLMKYPNGGYTVRDEPYNEYQAKRVSGRMTPYTYAPSKDNVDDTTLMTDDEVPSSSKGNKALGIATSLTPYIDNISGAIYNNQRAKETIPNKSILTYLNPKYVNYSQALKDTRDVNRSFTKGINETNASSATANIMKAYGLNEQNKSIARISQEENNVNTGIFNDFTTKNKSIEENNINTVFNNAERQRLGRDEIRREGQQNIVDTNKKLQTQIRSNNQKNDDSDAELQFDERSRKYVEDQKGKRKPYIWSRNGGKLGKLKISY